MIVSFGATQLKDNLLYEMYDGARENLSAAIVVGALLIVVGCIGCFGAFTSHRSGVLCFFIFCVAVLVGQLFVITFFYARMHEDSVQLEQSAFKVKWIEFAKDARQKGSDDAAVEDRRKQTSRFLTLIQTEYECCAYDEDNDPALCDDDAMDDEPASLSSCPPERTTVVFSLGSANSFSFERDLAALCPCCRIYIFDCLPTYIGKANRQFNEKKFHRYIKPRDRHRVTFERTCIGRRPDTASSSENWKTFAEAARDLGHRRVDLLKMDIEGSEYDVLDHLLGEQDDGGMPSIWQIMVELHVFKTTRDALEMRDGRAPRYGPGSGAPLAQPKTPWNIATTPRRSRPTWAVRQKAGLKRAAALFHGTGCSKAQAARSKSVPTTSHLMARGRDADRTWCHAPRTRLRRVGTTRWLRNMDQPTNTENRLAIQGRPRVPKPTR